MASFVLVVHAPGAAPRPYEFTQARVLIGREQGDVVLPDARCSSTHGEVLFESGAVRFRDLHSTNGTWVNGQRVTEMAWAPGTSLQIGSHQILLQEIRGVAPGRGRTVAGDVMSPVANLPPAYGSPPGYPQAPPAYAQYPQRQAPHGYGPPARKGSSTALWIALPLVLVGACGLGVFGLYKMGAPTTQDAGATAGPAKMTEPRETNVQFVWFAGEPGPTAHGGTANARVRVSPNKTGAVSVGVSEEFAGGGGNQWRTATWLAAFNSTRTLGASLSDYEFDVHVGGHTDGPSAGMITTSTMLALMRNKPLRADTTMTGTINPDGTAGPVGGIVQKMQGAKAAGLKRFGFPIGCRNHKDMQTGQDVDLMTVGSGLGLEVKEIGDVYEGYEFLTGDTLPRTEGLAESEMEPSAQTQALLRAKLGVWKSRVDREIANLKQEVKRTGVPAELSGPLIAEADKRYSAGETYEKNSFLTPALDSYAQAAIAVAVATRATTAFSYMFQNKLNDLIDGVNNAQKVKGDVDALGQTLEVKAQNKTRGGQVSTAAAFTFYVNARSATMIGDDFLDGAVDLLKKLESGKIQPTTEARVALMERILVPTLYYDMASVYMDYSRDMLDLIADEGTGKPMEPVAVDRMVGGYASASSAVLAYFDALITNELAKDKGISPDEAKAAIANREGDYYLATKANSLSEYAPKTGVSDGVKLMRLAAASVAYLDGAKLVNKWYSLDGHFDSKGQLVLENRRALTAQLDLARRTARESAARAKSANGVVPTPARLAFQMATAQREGSDEDKLEALAAYWQSSFWSELAAAPSK